MIFRPHPSTDKGKINWWLKNNDIQKDKYSIPKPDTDDFFNIFLDFGEGYKQRKMAMTDYALMI
ncbi:DUF943 family protein [Erwinia sp. CPCC 100877]|nr:DUF943 family protein [Erwinia sp. CPCC 100877]